MALDTIPKQEGGKLKAVASGTLPSGQPVVVNSDGTVSVVDQETFTESVGSATVFSATNSTNISAGFDSTNNRVVIAYRDGGNSSYGTAVVGTVSGDTISFGSPVVFEAASVEDNAVTFDTVNDKVVICYRDSGNSSYGTAIVGTVSGTSISFGTPTVFASFYSQYVSNTFATTSGKVVVACRDTTSTDDGVAYVGTVSGTSISFGSGQVFESGSCNRLDVDYDLETDRLVFAWSASGNVGNTKVGTISGSTISYGSTQEFEGSGVTHVSVSTNNSGLVFVAYISSDTAKAFAATIGNDSITKGTTVTIEGSVTEFTSTYDSDFDKFVLLYKINSPSNTGKYAVGSASGTTLTFETPVAYYNDNAEDVAITFDSTNGKVVFVYRDSGNLAYGTARTFQNAGSVTNLTAENYIGISSGGAVADTGNATVDIVGTVNKDQSGLTAGQAYYVQTDGTIGTTADDPSVLAGTAVSATKLVVKS